MTFQRGDIEGFVIRMVGYFLYSARQCNLRPFDFQHINFSLYFSMLKLSEQRLYLILQGHPSNF